MKSWCLIGAILLSSLWQISAQSFPHPVPVNPRDFSVMAWDFPRTDPESLAGMKDAGITVAGFCSAEDVAKIRAAGLTCFLLDKRIEAYDWKNLPPDEQIRKDLSSIAKEFGKDPTVIGLMLNDEPEASQFKGLAHVVDLMKEILPGKWPYVNLFPYREVPPPQFYANYAEYVKGLTEGVHPSFLSFDNYALSGGEMGDEWFTNLEYVRNASQEAKIPFWSCVLSCAHFGYMEPTNATLALQAWSTLAYGGRGIQYFNYFTAERGNYRLGPIDPFGHRTPTWDMLQRVNYQLHALAPTMLKLKSTGVYHYPDVPKQGKELSESRLVKWISMVKDEDQYVKPSIAARFLVGEFEDDQGRPYLMIVNKDLTYSFRFAIEFKQKPMRMFRINPYSGREERLVGEQNWLAPGSGVLIRAE